MDLALVAVPPRFHAPIALELLDLGIHVLCEKPTATSSADAERMAKAAEQNNCILAIGLMTRFHSNNRVLKKLWEEGLLGEIRKVHSQRLLN